MVVFASDSNEEGRWYCLAGKLVEGGVVCRDDMADIVVELLLVLMLLLMVLVLEMLLAEGRVVALVLL